MYFIVKHIHVVLVVASLAFFQIRYWRYKHFNFQPKRVFKILPHIIDTLLLISGIGLATLTGFSPHNTDWLLFKIIAVVLYIILGIIAMRADGVTSKTSYALATLTVIYIVLVAFNKVPWPIF